MYYVSRSSDGSSFKVTSQVFTIHIIKVGEKKYTGVLTFVDHQYFKHQPKITLTFEGKTTYDIIRNIKRYIRTIFNKISFNITSMPDDILNTKYGDGGSKWGRGQDYFNR